MIKQILKSEYDSSTKRSFMITAIITVQILMGPSRLSTKVQAPGTYSSSTPTHTGTMLAVAAIDGCNNN